MDENKYENQFYFVIPSQL